MVEKNRGAALFQVGLMLRLGQRAVGEENVLLLLCYFGRSIIKGKLTTGTGDIRDIPLRGRHAEIKIHGFVFVFRPRVALIATLITPTALNYFIVHVPISSFRLEEALVSLDHQFVGIQDAQVLGIGGSSLGGRLGSDLVQVNDCLLQEEGLSSLGFVGFEGNNGAPADRGGGFAGTGGSVRDGKGNVELT